MISKNELKYIKSLQLKKFREEEGQFIAEGKNNVEEGINSSYKCTHIILSEKYAEADPEILQIAQEKNIRYSITGEDEFNKAAGSVSPQGIMAVFNIPEVILPDFSSMDEPMVFLDEISDPGNVGTIIRTSDWFGIKHFLLSSGCADIYNPKTVRASAGSIFHLNLYKDIELSDIKGEVSKAGYDVAATVLDGEDLYKTELQKKIIIIFSNESNGVSPEILKLVNKQITVPKYGEAESLNVANAAAVVLAEIKRRGKIDFSNFLGMKI
jgi:RNA methyltransferase, TrmH family